MPVGSLAVDDALPLLGHEQAEGQAEVSFEESLPESVRGLLRVAHLREVGSLEEGGRERGRKEGGGREGGREEGRWED